MKPGMLNVGIDRLSCIEIVEEPNNLEEGLPDAQLFAVHIGDDHLADIVYFLITRMALEGYTSQQKKVLAVHTNDFSVILGNLYKMVADEISQRYVPYFKRDNILAESNGGDAGGHYVGKATV